MNTDQQSHLIALLHVKVDAAIAMSKATLEMMSKVHQKPSAHERLTGHIKKMMSDIEEAAKQTQLAIAAERKWYVTNHDTNQRIAGPFSTNNDAGRAREILERFENHHNYWIEELES